MASEPRGKNTKKEKFLVKHVSRQLYPSLLPSTLSSLQRKASLFFFFLGRSFGLGFLRKELPLSSWVRKKKRKKGIVGVEDVREGGEEGAEAEVDVEEVEEEKKRRGMWAGLGKGGDQH